MNNNNAKPIRIILADDHPIVRAGIRAELEKIEDVEIAGEASDGREALDLIKDQKPDVVFMDISMRNLNGLEATARITKEFPQVRVIILSMPQNEEYFWQALKAGASGYLLKKAATAARWAPMPAPWAQQIRYSRAGAFRSAVWIDCPGVTPVIWRRL